MQLADAVIQLQNFGLYAVSSLEKMRIRGSEQPTDDDPFTLEYKNGNWLAWITAGLYFVSIKKSLSLREVVDAVINYYTMKKFVSDGEPQIKSFLFKLEVSGLTGEISTSKSIRIFCEANLQSDELPNENKVEIVVEYSDEMWGVKVGCVDVFSNDVAHS